MNSYQIIKTRLDQTKQQSEALAGQVADLLKVLDKSTLGMDGRSPLRRKVMAVRKTLTSFHGNDNVSS